MLHMSDMQLYVKRVVGVVIVSLVCIMVIFCWLRSTNNSSLSGEVTLMLQNIPLIPIVAINTSTQSNEEFMGMLDESQFIFHKGMDSADNNIELNITIREHLIDIEELMMECMRMAGRCVGFTTDGSLKHFIQPYNNWTMNKEEEGGLYTLDTNYCKLSQRHHCTVGRCLNTFNGTYSCVVSTNISSTDHDSTHGKDIVIVHDDHSKNYSSYIHIVVSVDLSVLDGLIAMVQSVIEHTGNNDVMIHIVVNSTNRQTIKNRITCSLSIPHNVEIIYRVFDLSEEFLNLIKINGKMKYLSSSANFARLFFHQLFPELSHVLYLDVDLIVQHDISELWKEVINHQHLLTVIHRETKNCSEYFLHNMTFAYYKRYHKRLDKLECNRFNAGVVGFNLDKWRKNKIFDEVEYWMGENLKQELWELGTQPIMYLVSIGDLKVIEDERWNVLNLGAFFISKEKVKNGYIIHWNGRDKPWGIRMSLDSNKKRRRWTKLYDKLWKTYHRKVCHDKGTCVSQTKETPAVCVCHKRYTGEHCENRHHTFKS